MTKWISLTLCFCIVLLAGAATAEESVTLSKEVLQDIDHFNYPSPLPNAPTRLGDRIVDRASFDRFSVKTFTA